MNKRESAQILAVIKAAYPGHSNKNTINDDMAAVNAWADILSDYSYNEVAAAVKGFIASDIKGFPPAIGQIVHIINQHKAPQIPLAEAWNLIQKAASNSTYNAVSEFEKLPEPLQQIVGSPSRLKTYATMSSETLETVVYNGFAKQYTQCVEREREQMALPQAVKQLLIEGV